MYYKFLHRAQEIYWASHSKDIHLDALAKAPDCSILWRRYQIHKGWNFGQRPHTLVTGFLRINTVDFCSFKLSKLRNRRAIVFYSALVISLNNGGNNVSRLSVVTTWVIHKDSKTGSCVLHKPFVHQTNTEAALVLTFRSKLERLTVSSSFSLRFLFWWNINKHKK